LAKQKFGVYAQEVPERAVLVGIDRGDPDWPLEESLAELKRLTKTAGAEVVYTMSQRLDKPNPRTFIGQGKAEELVSIVRNLDADLVIVDDELSPSQQSNLEKLLGAPVKLIDRTALILDIFALHATTKEGRLQVKLAQNQYLYPRLRGMWSHLAAGRMGGGVGSRFGEGESQLEVDRRLIRKRIDRIKRELKELETNRRTQRKQRSSSGVFRIALAGYTNAGKSSLMNALTDADVLAYDKLFATLDSTTRKLRLPDGYLATLTDTVGFIQKLPHELVESFHSTLEEIKEADLILLVVDVAARQRTGQLAAVKEVLGQIGAHEIPTLTVFNKVDLMYPADEPEDDEGPREDRRAELAHLHELYPDALFVSARTGEGIDGLVSALQDQVRLKTPHMQVLLPYDQGRLVERAHEQAVIQEERYTERGTYLSLDVPEALVPYFEPFQVAEDSIGEPTPKA
jgi:GTP-binding protein HflX